MNNQEPSLTSALSAVNMVMLGMECGEQCHCDTFQELVMRKDKMQNTEERQPSHTPQCLRKTARLDKVTQKANERKTTKK